MYLSDVKAAVFIVSDDPALDFSISGKSSIYDIKSIINQLK